jgi:hypothetical protein
VVFSQAAPFSGPAYRYLRPDDELPTYREIADEQDPLCQVKLFLPAGSRWTFHVWAATEYEGIDGPVLTGYWSRRLAPTAMSSATRGPRRSPGVRLGGPPPSATSTSSPCACPRSRPTCPRHGYGP